MIVASRVVKLLAIVAYAALSLADASRTSAATGSGPVILPAPTNTLRVGAGAGAYAGKVIITFDVAEPASWSYDPGSGRLSKLPAIVSRSQPIAGVAVAVAKDPNGPPPHDKRVIGALNGDGVAKFNSNMSDEGFDLVISVPANATKRHGISATAAKAAALKFAVLVGANGEIMVQQL